MKGFTKGRLRPAVVAPLALAGALVAALTVFATVGAASTTRAAAAPANTQPPTVAGTPTVGSTLAIQNGTWSGTTPLAYAYQWRRCDETGGSCSDISGATDGTYVLKTVDSGDTLRAVVTAKNTDGSGSETTVPTAVISAQAVPAPTGCPKTALSTDAVAVTDVTSPARLQLDAFQVTSGQITYRMTGFTLRVHVSDTCGQPVQGAQVYATAVPYNQVSVPPQQATGSDGWVTLAFSRLDGFPVSSKQQLLTLFLRASKPGDDVLAGISTRRLVSVSVTPG
jgi:hypothetical protein